MTLSGDGHKLSCDIRGCSRTASSVPWPIGWVRVGIEVVVGDPIEPTHKEKKLLCPTHSAMLNYIHWKAL